MRNLAAAAIGGGPGADILAGGAGDDRLSGAAGADTLLGGAGDDTLIGGAGDDVARFEGTSRSFRFGLLGDSIVVRDLASGDAVLIDPSVERVAFANGALDFGDLAFAASERETSDFPTFLPEAPATPSARAEFLAGAGGADVIDGLGGADRIEGAGGGDSLSGGAGADTLLGEAGRDSLSGGGGVDRLEGGGGADSLLGGAGADSFVIAPGGGQDRIGDFGRGADAIAFAAGPDSFDDLEIVQRGDDAVIRFEGGSVRLEGVAAASLAADDFLF